MKTVIYYFTGTGNNLAVAKKLAQELEGPVELTPIAGLVKEKSIHPDADVVGIVFPVYLRDVPDIVAEFANKLASENTYVFGVCTFHKDAFNALFNLNAILERNGIQLDAGFRVNMPGNSVLVVDFTSTDAENEIRFREAQQKIKAITKIVNEREPAGIEGHFDKNEKYDTKNYIKHIYKAIEKFWVDNNCDLCGLCVQVCPKGTIALINNKPTWTGHCENCLACLHWCPQAAIQNGENSAKCRRYHHPEIAVEEVINQN